LKAFATGKEDSQQHYKAESPVKLLHYAENLPRSYSFELTEKKSSLLFNRLKGYLQAVSRVWEEFLAIGESSGRTLVQTADHETPGRCLADG
jgi:hypothetical protein